MALDRSVRFSVAAGSSMVSGEVIDQISGELRRIIMAYPHEPVAVVFFDLVEIQEALFRLLEGQVSSANARELYFLAGLASGLLATANEDLGNLHAATAHARTAFICADNSGSDSLRTRSRFLQANIAYWDNRPLDAVRYTEMAADSVRRVRGTVAPSLHAMEARARAALGDSEGARSALARARDAREAVLPDVLDDIGGQVAFPLAKQLYYAADTELWLPGGSADQTERALDAVLAYEQAPVAEKSFINEALCRMSVALGRIMTGEIEGARDALIPVLELPPNRRSDGIRAFFVRIQNALRAPRYLRSSVARDLQMEIEFLIST
jgi:hypothetical protein